MIEVAEPPVISPDSGAMLDAAPSPADPAFTWAGLTNAASNICLAMLFFGALLPGVNTYGTDAAGLIWTGGAALMGVFSLVRFRPKIVMINVRSLAATSGMMLIPMLIRPGVPSAGILHNSGLMVELAGVGFTQLARVYLGRSFGLLPANRGIVCSGPFRLMRHPIYLGWLLLTVGFTMIYPSPRNVLTIFVLLPFMMWRITQEEELLSEDAEYRAYMRRVPYRLLPFTF
jgi:protein-S-isoprenylcysteine O-methyltransferase Ste14